MVTKSVKTSERIVWRNSVFTNMLDGKSVDLEFDSFGVERGYENDGGTEMHTSKGEQVDWLVLKFKDLDESISLRWQTSKWKVVVEDAKGIKRDTFVKPKGTFNELLEAEFNKVPVGTKLHEAAAQLNKVKAFKGAKVRITVKNYVRVNGYRDANKQVVRTENDKVLKDMELITE